MRLQLMALRLRWRQIPGRTRMGMMLAVIAMAGLAWQHYTGGEAVSPAADTRTVVSGQDMHEHEHSHSHDMGEDAAAGEYQPDPSELVPRLDLSPEAARAAAERFATNFAAPNANRDDWLARISPDVVPDLLDQYRTTDIRNLPQAAVVDLTGPLPGDPATPSFHVAYSDGTNVELRLEMSGGGWQVATVLPLTPNNPAAPDPSPLAPEVARIPGMKVASLTDEAMG